MKYWHICTILGAIGAAIELLSVQTTAGISAPQDGLLGFWFHMVAGLMTSATYPAKLRPYSGR